MFKTNVYIKNIVSMTNILHVDSSPRREKSYSRMLAKEFIAAWKKKNPEDTITYRDLYHHSVPHINEAWINAAYTPEKERNLEMVEALKISDFLVDEFLAAECYVYSVPMYNYSIPSVFKAYIDQIIRINRTFAIEPRSLEKIVIKGLVEGQRKMIIISTRGGSYPPGTRAAAYDFQKPYLKAIFGAIGIKNITFINANRLGGPETIRDRSLEEARTAMRKVLNNW